MRPPLIIFVASLNVGGKTCWIDVWQLEKLKIMQNYVEQYCICIARRTMDAQK